MNPNTDRWHEAIVTLNKGEVPKTAKEWLDLVSGDTGDGSYFRFSCDDLHGLIAVVLEHGRREGLEEALKICIATQVIPPKHDQAVAECVHYIREAIRKLTEKSGAGDG